MNNGKDFGRRTAKHNKFYTHYSMTAQLFEKEGFDHRGSVLEPACGEDHMVKVLKTRFEKVEYYDLEHREKCRRDDFYNEKEMYDYIITNPPYGKEVDKFVMKAKEICIHKFAFLTRLNYLSGQTRFNQGIYKGLKKVYVFTRMSDLTAEIRPDGKYPTAMIVYAWMIWEMGFDGKPVFDWIDNQKYVLKKGE